MTQVVANITLWGVIVLLLVLGYLAAGPSPLFWVGMLGGLAVGLLLGEMTR